MKNKTTNFIKNKENSTMERFIELLNEYHENEIKVAVILKKFTDLINEYNEKLDKVENDIDKFENYLNEYEEMSK